ncbi:MAG: hypothetical protein HRT51_19605 [Colwellia sp.]|nr:hypothetical protein [Colwellia sp.]
MIKEQDPMTGMKGLQDAILNGYAMDRVVSGTAKDGVRFCSDVGGKRLTYATIKRKKVQSYIAFSAGDGLHKNEICFGIFYAVPVKMRGKKLMEQLYSIAVKDMKNSLNKNFYVEAIVDQNNSASNHVAKKLFGPVQKSSIDQLSGEPVNAYFKLCIS